jgi:hypothetical protein
VVLTDLLSRSWITIGIEISLNVGKLLQSLHMWCNTPESMTHFGAAAAAAIAEVVSQKLLLSSVIARAAIAMAFFTVRHSILHL